MTILGYVLFIFPLGYICEFFGGMLGAIILGLVVDLFGGRNLDPIKKVMIGAVGAGIGASIIMYFCALGMVHWFGCSGGFFVGAGSVLYTMTSWKVNGAIYAITVFLLIYLPLSFFYLP